MSNHPKIAPHPALWYGRRQRDTHAEADASQQQAVYSSERPGETLPYPALSIYAIIALHLPAWLVVLYLYFLQ